MSIARIDFNRYALPGEELAAAAPNRAAVLAMYGFLLVVIAAPMMQIKENVRYTGQGDLAREIAFVVVLAMALVATQGAQGAQGVRRFFNVPVTLALALGWCWLSMVWAMNPDVTIRRLLLTTMIVVIIFNLAQALRFEETVRIVRRVFVITLAASYAAVLLAPSIGIHRAADVAGIGIDPDLIGCWKGVLAHKNYAGVACAFTVILFTFDARGMRLLPRAAVILGALLFLYKTRSKTSAGILVAAIVCGWLFTMYNPRRRVAVVSIIVVVAAAIAIFVYYDWDALSAPFNRPDAFTGRVQIWKVLVEYHSDHPLGSGYGSFWNIGPDRQMLHYVKSTNWVAGQPQAHNGYLDLLVQLGMPGLILGILAFIVAPIGRLLVSLEARRAQGGMLLAMIIFSAGHNFTESSYLDRDQLVEVFCLLAIALVGVIARPNRAKRAARLIP